MVSESLRYLADKNETEEIIKVINLNQNNLSILIDILEIPDLKKTNKSENDLKNTKKYQQNIQNLKLDVYIEKILELKNKETELKIKDETKFIVFFNKKGCFSVT